MSPLSGRRNENAVTFPSFYSNFTTRFWSSSLWDDDSWNYGRSNSPQGNISETDKEFSLEFSLPGLKGADIHLGAENAIEARYKNGVKVTLPKKEMPIAMPQKQISIK